VGVCGTDLQILNGTRPDTAEILGHEGAGVVVEAGQGALLREGERVVFNPSAQLPAGRIVGHNMPGLFQRYICVGAQAVNDGVVLPMEESLPPICGALVEPLAGVVYSHELISRAVPELRSVVVFGAGPAGLLTVAYLKGMGIKILLVHPSRTRLDAAVALNLVEEAAAITLSEDLSEQIRARNGGADLDAAVICTSMRGAEAALRHAVEVVRSGGCIELVTNYPSSSAAPEGVTTEALRRVRATNVCGMPDRGEYLTADISGRRLTFTGLRGTSGSHLRRAMAVLRNAPSQYTSLITHVLPLQEAAEPIQALSALRSVSIDGRDCIKAVVDLTCSPQRHSASE
jgi:threonine dehydrogenase-like Zn-dependent dehydrogenase